jgi:hypothetical protein
MAGPLDTPVYLKPRELLPVENGVGIEVKALRGNLWITQAGDAKDKVLGPGESFVIDRAGLTLVTALLGPAVLVLQPGRIAAGRELRRAA